MTKNPSRRLSPAALLVVPLAAAIVLAMFVWPSSRLEPRDLPVAVAGPPAAADAVEQKLAARDGAFEIHRYADKAAARDAIEDRDVYGAVVATHQGAEVLTASAAGASVASLLARRSARPPPRAAALRRRARRARRASARHSGPLARARRRAAPAPDAGAA